MSMMFMKVPLIQLGLATGTYLVLSLLLGYKEILDKKFGACSRCTQCPQLAGKPQPLRDSLPCVFNVSTEFLHEYDLGFVYLCIYIICLGRARIMVNSNAVRSGARIDRYCEFLLK